MGAEITCKVEGVDKLLKNLKKWQVIKVEACKGALKNVGHAIERDTKLGPVPLLTGRLKSSISTNWSGSGRTRGPTGKDAWPDDGVGEPPGPAGLVVVVGTNVKYAHMQEFGTWGDAPKPEKQISMPRRKDHEPLLGGRPKGGYLFLSKAYHAHESDAEKRIKEILRRDEAITR